MARYRALITDLTEYGNLRCVAGVNLANKSMIRPEPAPGSFWTDTDCAPNGAFALGNVVTFEANSPKPHTDFPHMTEEMVVEGEAKIDKTLEPEKFIRALSGLHTPLNKIFGKHVEFSNGKPFIRTGTKCASLYGTNVERSAIEFHEAYEKPRIMLDDSGIRANLSITALSLRELYRSKGLAALAAQFKSAKELHLRIGLARGFGSYPDRCYMQINGIFILS